MPVVSCQNKTLSTITGTGKPQLTTCSNMNFYNYFQSYQDYFWQWEDDTQVIAIPNSHTVAYTTLVTELLGQLVPLGWPPFGSFLLAIIASNPKGRNTLDSILKILENKQELLFKTNFDKTTREYNFKEAFRFLSILSQVPEEYKTGKKRILLFQAIFEQPHNATSIVKSRSFLKTLSYNKSDKNRLSAKTSIDQNKFSRDFRTLALLHKKFKTVEDIINKIASLPIVEKEIIPFEESNPEKEGSKDIVEQLIEHPSTFYVGALIKRLWSGLNIPSHSVLPSQQPLGGVSDLTNKGDYDKLLISEFANDDLVFLSRLANNEALYLHREIPPSDNNFQRIILMDVSLKNWGTPKTIAFATTLAIANHPKTNIECSAFAIGNSYYPISIENIDAIIQGLQIVDSNLHPANGLAAFFKDNSSIKNKEIFVITESSNLKQNALLKAMEEYKSSINYWIFTDIFGNIDVYRNQQNSRKHLQKIQLPLQELWEKKRKKTESPKNKIGSNYPILFPNTSNNKAIMTAPDGEVFRITKDKKLFRLYDKTEIRYKKGWELIENKLPFSNGNFEIGIDKNGDYILLMFSQPNSQITLLNINTNQKNIIDFRHGTHSPSSNFIFHNQKFIHRSHKGFWSINLDGDIVQENTSFHELFNTKIKKTQELSRIHSYTSNVFKKIKRICINGRNNLVFNSHELLNNEGKFINLGRLQSFDRRFQSKKTTHNEFTFRDGSNIQINSAGMFILKSSDTNIPYIYILSALDSSLVVATKDAFAGNMYYYKEPLYEVELENAGNNKIAIIKEIKKCLGIGLKEAKEVVDTAPHILSKFCPHDKAIKIKNTLEENGAIVNIRTVNQKEDSTVGINNISTVAFFKEYIEAFVNHIIAHGTKT